jgi:hypothetical protein
VRQAADRQDVRQWAGEVENAAFGPIDVDEGVETRLKDQEPGPV